MEIDDRSNGARLRAHLGDAIRLQLEETPTTGFRWRLIRDGAPACAPSGDRFEPGQAPGAAGVHTWTFRAAEPGLAEIKLVLARTWEDPGAATRRFAVGVQVEPS